MQNSLGVTGFHPIPPDVVAGQIRAVVEDIGVGAVKTGMLATAGIIDAIADTAEELGIGRRRTVSLSSSTRSAPRKHGDPLLTPEALETLLRRRPPFPLAWIVTPNLDEVRLITGIEVVDDASQRAAARALHALGPRWALVRAATSARPSPAPTSSTTVPTSSNSKRSASTPGTTTARATPWAPPPPAPSPTA